MESILTDILMKVSDVLTQKTALRVSDVLTHPGQRCPDTCQLGIKGDTNLADQLRLAKGDAMGTFLSINLIRSIEKCISPSCVTILQNTPKRFCLPLFSQ